jgi:hypothetical protein
VGYKAEVFGKAGIVARVLNKSVCSDEVTITSYELEYPRMIHSELLTHKMFSRNAASSRAIPIAKSIESVRNSPAMPVEWGKNKPGMQSDGEIDDPESAKWMWIQAAKQAADRAEQMAAMGLHKQVVNRILEPFVFMKTVLTVTEENNFFWLRDHEDADPTIHELATCMRQASSLVLPNQLLPGEWHFAYVDTDVGFDKTTYHIDGEEIDLETAKKIDAACCAQVSFRKLDTSTEKALQIYDRLASSTPVHASPFEHAATPVQSKYKSANMYDSLGPINVLSNNSSWEEGITHVDRDGYFWSGNFKSWIQHRQLIADNFKKG